MDSEHNNFKDVKDFHKKFGLPHDGPSKPLDPEMAAYRIGFMQEELREYIVAYQENDLEKQFDALLDLVYVAMGTAVLHGFPWQEGWDEVQRANMSKVRATSAEQSKRGSVYDVVKPEGWRGPDLKSVLERQAAPWRAQEHRRAREQQIEGFDESD